MRNFVLIKRIVILGGCIKKSPIICAGGGVFLSEAQEELKTFAEKFQIPVVSTMMGIGVMPTEHPLYYGNVGNNGKPYANRAMNESDLLIMVGARVADRAVSQPDLITKGKILVHIDVDPAEIGKNAGATIPLVGDAKHIFQDFLNEEVSVSGGNPNTPSSPGQMLKHYAPKYETRINVTHPAKDEFMIGFGDIDGHLNLSPSGNLAEATANLFAYMHMAEEQTTYTKIAIAPIPMTGLGRAINDRIKRASYRD